MMRSLAVFFGLLAACSAGDDSSGGPGGGTRDGGSGADVQAVGDAPSNVVDAVSLGDGGMDDSLLCLTTADCPNNNPCATPRCEITGEIGQCVYDPMSDGTSCSAGTACGGTCMGGICHAATCEPRDGGVRDRRDAGTTGGDMPPPVDTVCDATCPLDTRQTPIFPPFVSLAPDDVPATCHNGFQLGGARGGCGVAVYTLHSRNPAGASAITLDVDFATYLVPDGVTVTGIDATGSTYTLMATCRLQTYSSGGPSTSRPMDAMIRQYRIDVRPGTTQLTFDFGQVTSPMYMRVVGLCDFDVTPFANAAWWEAVP
jgi:hypothetical protein